MRSHKLASAAQASGKFKEEIVPVHTKVCGIFFVCVGGVRRGGLALFVLCILCIATALLQVC